MFERGIISEIDVESQRARVILGSGAVSALLPGHALVIWPPPDGEPPVGAIDIGMTVSVLFYTGAGYADGLIMGVY